MMRPGTAFEPAYKLMADYKAHEDDCERLNMSYDAEYRHVKLVGVQNTLKAPMSRRSSFNLPSLPARVGRA